MALPFTPEQVRQRLRLDEGVDQALVDLLSAAAVATVEEETGRTFDGGTFPFSDNQKVIATNVALILIMEWLDNPASRPIGGGGKAELPPMVAFCLFPLKRLTV